ncbi:hypothetical protein [Mycetohabitans endofungorum]|uniref:hypothetical protein n=1 Tax=Mycetohabitans endofungorum TaxID=417203 RepID=UPI002B05C382|nr:hypothetical protein [Mycetohabitans endofungorum]
MARARLLASMRLSARRLRRHSRGAAKLLEDADEADTDLRDTHAHVGDVSERDSSGGDGGRNRRQHDDRQDAPSEPGTTGFRRSRFARRVVLPSLATNPLLKRSGSDDALTDAELMQRVASHWLNIREQAVKDPGARITARVHQLSLNYLYRRSSPTDVPLSLSHIVSALMEAARAHAPRGALHATVRAGPIGSANHTEQAAQTTLELPARLNCHVALYMFNLSRPRTPAQTDEAIRRLTAQILAIHSRAPTTET